MERHPIPPGCLHLPPSRACWLLPPLSAQNSPVPAILSVFGPTFIPVDHSTASLLLEMAMDYSYERQEVRWVKYRPRCWIRVCGLGWGLDWLSSWQAAWGPKYSRTNAKGQGGSMGGNKWLMGGLLNLTELLNSKLGEKPSQKIKMENHKGKIHDICLYPPHMHRPTPRPTSTNSKNDAGCESRSFSYVTGRLDVHQRVYRMAQDFGYY